MSSILKKIAKTLPYDLLRKIVTYVPQPVSIHKTGLKEMLRRLSEDLSFRSKMISKYPIDSICSFRAGKNKLKTQAAMTYEDPWYGECHLMILNRKNKKNPMEFRATFWHVTEQYPNFRTYDRNKISLHFLNQGVKIKQL